MKAVIDTNVFVSSFFGGNPKLVIDLWRTGKITLCLSPEIVEEYVAVLKRLKLEAEEELKELLNLFAKGCNSLFSSKPAKLKIIKEDPADDEFIECAVALQAQVIITGDSALRAIRNYMGIRIFRPKEFLDFYIKNSSDSNT